MPLTDPVSLIEIRFTRCWCFNALCCYFALGVSMFWFTQLTMVDVEILLFKHPFSPELIERLPVCTTIVLHCLRSFILTIETSMHISCKEKSRDGMDAVEKGMLFISDTSTQVRGTGKSCDSNRCLVL